MFHAELISLSRGQSYDQVDILEARHGDFEKYGVPEPFGLRTVAFFYNNEIILAHPWGVRIIHLDKDTRGSNSPVIRPKCFQFDRIIIDGDSSYANGYYIDDDYFAEMGIPDLFEDPGEVIDQVTFSCSQGTFITHDANIVSIVKKHTRGDRGITKAVRAAQPIITQPTTNNANHGKINRRAR